MKILKNLLTILTIVSLAAGVLATLYGVRQKNEKNRAENNLYSKTVQWEDERGRLVTETTELRFTTRELRQVAKKDSARMSEVEKKLLAARSAIDALNLKLRKVESVNMIALESHGEYATSYNIQPADTHYILKIDPVKTKFLDIEFHQAGDSLIIDHHYRNSIDIIIDREQGLSNKDRKRFFLARWINPKWQYSSNVVCEDPSAEITSNVYIRFQKRKGKRD